MHNFGEWEYPYEDLANIPANQEQLAALSELWDGRYEEVNGPTLGEWLDNSGPLSYLTAAELIAELMQFIEADEGSNTN
jgi:hypothetical protein